MIPVWFRQVLYQVTLKTGTVLLSSVPSQSLSWNMIPVWFRQVLYQDRP